MSRPQFNLLKFGSDIIFSSLPFMAGFVGGLQFPIANKIYLSVTNNVTKSASITYGADLLGSCIGALLVSTLIMPLVGIYGTCILVTLLNLVAFIMLLFGRGH